MKLNEVHRILKFNESDLLKRYFGFNADKKNTANSFEEKRKKF